MKPKNISDAMEHLDETMLLEADRMRQKKRRRLRWLAPVAAVLVLSIVALAVLAPLGSTPVSASELIAAPTYPAAVDYPQFSDYADLAAYNAALDEWASARTAQRYLPEAGYDAGLEDFFRASAKEFLSGGNGQNRVYSPLNVYLALSMLAEITGGESRAQILSLLGAESIEALRTQANEVWRANYCNSGLTTSILANSVWLNESIEFKQDTLERLAEDYYAASYRGVPGSEEFDGLLRDWLDEQTGGLLHEQVKEVNLDPSTVIALASTVYFHAQWIDTFSESATAPDVFYAPDGEQTVPFMHRQDTGLLYLGEHFSAVCRGMEDGGKMWLILPDEGVTPEDLLQDGEALELTQNWDNVWSGKINLSVPKFDVTSDVDLRDGLQALGVTDVFDTARSDFSPLTDLSGQCLSKVRHAARVLVEEDGCTATAFTLMGAEGAFIPPEEEVDFTLNRPFLFLLDGIAGQPLFIGIVNQP